LDNHATTKVDPRVLETMLPYFSEIYGNAASKAHEFGWKADSAVELARKQAAWLIGAEQNEIVFTSGATESINLAIKGASEAYSEKGNEIISTPVEHRAALDTLNSLEKKGFKVVYLKVDKYGLINPEQLNSLINKKTILVTVMYANNEIGSINNLEDITTICNERRVLIHTDAVQAAGKIEIGLGKLKIDMLSFSAHKMYGPKGIGALYIKSKFPKIKIKPQIEGGGHERGLRSGTQNVPAIVGFGKACDICRGEMAEESLRIKSLRDKLERGLTSGLKDITVNGHPEKRLYNNSNVSFNGVTADSLILSIREIAVSSGSACSSASVRPSHVLKAIGLNEDLVKSSIRFGLGRFNTEEEIDYVIDKVVEKVNYLRDISPVYKAKHRLNA